MIMILLDAAVLLLLLKLVNDEDEGFWGAALLGLGASVGVYLLSLGMIHLMGDMGVYVALVLGAGILAFAVSAIYGIVLKRALLIAVIFFVVHIAIQIGLSALLSR